MSVALFGKKHEPSDPFGAAGFVNPTMIGTGASSNVFRAREVAFDRICAIKVFAISFNDGAARRRFERELRITGALGGHPNVVTVYRNGYLGDGRPFLSMEYCSNGSTADRLRTGGPLPVPDAVSLIIKAAGALQAAHDAGVVHRDVKPQNLLLRRTNDPVVADFGVAAAVAENESDVEAMTLSHAAVEVLGGSPASPASDQWSLASTLYELLTGAPPYTRRPQETLVAWTVRVLETPAAVVLRADVPRALVDIITRAMAKRPEDRWPSVAALAEALRSIEEEQGWDPTNYETSAGAVAVPKAPHIPASSDGPAARDPLLSAPPASPSPEAQAVEDTAPPSETVASTWGLSDDIDDGVTILRSRPVAPSVEATSSSPRRRWATAIAVVVVLALVGVGAGLALWSTDRRSEAPTPTTAPGTPATTTTATTTTTTTTTTTSQTAATYAPTNVRILDDTGDAVSLGWADSTEGVTTYVIDTTEHDVAVRPVERAQSATGTVVSGLMPGVSYCFSVGAVYAFGVAPAYASPVCRGR